MESKTTYLNNINYFRGIAIIFIVFGHSFTLGIWQFYDNTSFLAKLINFIAPGGTTFFVFISGYLLHHIYYKKLQLRNFLLKKLKYVVVPFLLFSSLDIIYYLTRLSMEYFVSTSRYEIFLEKIKSFDLIKIYLLGYSEIPIGLWYVPFIMVVFSLSKLYLKFAGINYKTQMWLISVLIILSSIIHRAPNTHIMSIFQNVLYFSPVYLLGIFISANQKIVYSKMIGREFYLLAIALVLTIFQIQIGKLEDIRGLNTISIKNIDFMIFQKSLLAIFFLFYLMRFVNKKMRLIDLLASNSFGIFFIHGIYIWFFNAIIIKLHKPLTSNSIFVFIIYATFVLILSLLTTILIKIFFPKKSKYIIGC